GCLESIASISELESTFNERIEKGEESIIQDIKEGPFNFEDMMLAANKNDYLANNIIEEAYRYIVIGISNLVNIFDPELLIIGGRFNIFDSSFFDDLKKDLSQITFANIVEDLEVKTTTRKCEFQLKAAASFVFDKWKQKI
ncbi:MAG: ROK family protein, partial [Bacillota bacterium]